MSWYQTLAWVVSQAEKAVPEESSMSVGIKLLAAVAVVAGSFGLGYLLARRLRMPDYSFKIGLVLFTLIASVAVCIAGWPPKRGIDLSGGVVLIYEVDKEQAQSDLMQSAVARVNEELRALGGERIEATPTSSDQLEIPVPAGVDVSQIEGAVAELKNTSDVLLQRTATRREDGHTVLVYSVAPQRQRAIDMPKLIAAVSRRINPSGVKELTIRQYGAEQLEVIIPEIEEREVDQIKQRISTSGKLEFRIAANDTDDRELIRAADKTVGNDVYLGGQLAGRWVKAGPDVLSGSRAHLRQTKAGGYEILARIDPYSVTGADLERAYQTEAEGRTCVGFTFKPEGGVKFGQLTSHNLPDSANGFHRQLGIILDNTMISAPVINSMIRDRGVIQGQFGEDYVQFLVGVLNAGSLPATLRPEPISQQRIGSQLGKDTIQAGTMAIGLSTLAILIFMALYYRFCGIVADIAVTLNMIVTVALMILIKAAFTLPGLAGMVLTVGMAVDANVLIYERMREETERGASLRMAIRNGFGRAMATIIDSHVTTLVSAAVLYVVGTDQIKGFAVTLIIGLLMSLFTAVFVARVIFDVAEKQRWLTRLKMMHVIGHTNIDFIRWRGPAIAGSVIIIAIGLVATAMRGPEILDIDFTGGSSVQILFDKEKPHDIAYVRTAVADLRDVAVSSVGENNLEFKIDTSDQDIDQVQKFLQERFAGDLQTYKMTYGEVALIEKPKPEEKAEEAAEGPALVNPQGSSETVPSETPKEKPAAEAAPAEKHAPTEKPAETPQAEGAEKPAAESSEAAPSGAAGKSPAAARKRHRAGRHRP